MKKHVLAGLVSLAVLGLYVQTSSAGLFRCHRRCRECCSPCCTSCAAVAPSCGDCASYEPCRCLRARRWRCRRREACCQQSCCPAYPAMPSVFMPTPPPPAMPPAHAAASQPQAAPGANPVQNVGYQTVTPRPAGGGFVDPYAADFYAPNPNYASR